CKHMSVLFFWRNIAQAPESIAGLTHGKYTANRRHAEGYFALRAGQWVTGHLIQRNPTPTKGPLMYKLYYSPGACSMAVHVLLNEIGAPLQLESASTKEGKNRSPEFLKINPRGQVPVLDMDGHIMREGGAILSYLCDKHNSPLLPREGIARADALEWLMFC